MSFIFPWANSNTTKSNKKPTRFDPQLFLFKYIDRLVQLFR